LTTTIIGWLAGCNTFRILSNDGGDDDDDDDDAGDISSVARARAIQI